MSRRFVPLMLAAIVGLSPMARELCALLCAESLAASPSTHTHRGSEHSKPAHDESPDHMGGHTHASIPPTGHSMAALSEGHGVAGRRSAPFITSPSACNHLGEWPAAFTSVTKQALDPPLAFPQVVEGIAPPRSVTWRPWVASDLSPPIPLALRTPLRV